MALYPNSTLFKNTFSTPEMREVFDESAFFETFMTVEAALARAEARAGLVPDAAAAEITEKASLEYLDQDRVAELVDHTGHVAMAIIGAWKDAFDEPGEYIHWGATTQDILDTTVVLQMRDALAIVTRDLRAVRNALADLAREHRDTPMIGRTHYVHAIPTTFGLKAAVWVDELDRHLARLAQLESRVLTGQFFGAVGTLASLGDDGLSVQEHLSDELDLPLPDVVWHAARDRYAEVVTALAHIGTTLSKISRQFLFMHRPEVHEVQETVSDGHIGSSTMPHKRNPKKNEGVVVLARLLRGQAQIMTEAMETVDERDASTWYAEFAVVPNAFLYASRLLANTRDVLDGLEIHPDRMAANLGIHGELVVSERVMMALATRMGRQTAHEVVADNAWAALDSDQSFGEALRSDERVTSALTDDDLTALLTPAEYTGLAGEYVDRVTNRNPP